jgi:hypothetical protein
MMGPELMRPARSPDLSVYRAMGLRQFHEKEY